MNNKEGIAFVSVILEEDGAIYLDMEWFPWYGNEEQLEAEVYATYPNIYEDQWKYYLDSEVEWVEEEDDV